MADTSDLDNISPFGPPAPIPRLFAWSMLAVLAAFLVNNVLVVGYGFPGLKALFAGGAGRQVWVQAAIYAGALAVAAGYVPVHRRSVAALGCARDPQVQRVPDTLGLLGGPAGGGGGCHHRLHAGGEPVRPVS
ncbi:hypothetical protein ACFOHS_00435 [Jhaorihella thermophila]